MFSKKTLKKNVVLFQFSFIPNKTLNICNWEKLKCVIKTVYSSFYLKKESMRRHTAFQLFPIFHSEKVLILLQIPPFIMSHPLNNKKHKS